MIVIKHRRRKIAGLLVTLVCTICISAPVQAGSVSEYKQWITDMKVNSRGPFERIRWFCKDGTILPPGPHACLEHGGGSQHGEWSDKTRVLREDGYYIANIYADLDIESLLNEESVTSILAQMLIEKFLVRIDNGWILRKARFYRGAFQEEGERAGARRLLLALLQKPVTGTNRFLQIRASAELLAHDKESSSFRTIRQMATDISEKAPGFIELRNKIHAHPDSGDAGRVRQYRETVSNEVLSASLEQLATQIDNVYTSTQSAQKLLADLLSRHTVGDLNNIYTGHVADLDPEQLLERRITGSSVLLRAIRDNLPYAGSEVRLQLLGINLALESELLAMAAELDNVLPNMSRKTRLQLLRQTIDALFGTGLISKRQYVALTDTFTELIQQNHDIVSYKRYLSYLELAAGWGTQQYRFFFARGEDKLAEIEPRARLFIQDQLRGSPLFIYVKLLDGLLLDAFKLQKVDNRIFNQEVGTGLRALNPGLARGVLHIVTDGHNPDTFSNDGIYVLPETIADLPPVAGIITAGEGNPLSHVQLLARNLGIPNVLIHNDLLDMLQSHAGKRIVMAVSPGGVVQIHEDNGQWDNYDRQDQSSGNKDFLIRPDLDKLDLSSRDLIDLRLLRAQDSGRIVGPKAAKLGELKHHYPDAVTEGLAIPFGIFRNLLNQWHHPSGKPVFEWIVSRYRYLESLPENSERRQQETEQFRDELEQWVLKAQPDDSFKTRLRAAMQTTFGDPDKTAVFIRSDTNVEDLPGFTGAGLNLTLPNVIGFERIYMLLNQVWASPFSRRAFAWRQAKMQQPQHVYPAILLLKAINVDKSGVMVTQDIDTGDRNVLTIAVNEGVGGAVDGQSAETLRVDTTTGSVRLMAQATAPLRRQLDPAGGITQLAASGNDYVLQENEIARLIDFSKALPHQFPPLVDDSNNLVAADIEFGFLKGKLYLFQIRPYLENTRAKTNLVLNQLDRTDISLQQVEVNLDEKPVH